MIHVGRPASQKFVRYPDRDRSLRLQYLAGLALDTQNAFGIYGTIVGYRRYPADLFDVSPGDEAALRRGY